MQFPDKHTMMAGGWPMVIVHLSQGDVAVVRRNGELTVAHVAPLMTSEGFAPAPSGLNTLLTQRIMEHPLVRGPMNYEDEHVTFVFMYPPSFGLGVVYLLVGVIIAPVGAELTGGLTFTAPTLGDDACVLTAHEGMEIPDVFADPGYVIPTVTVGLAPDDAAPVEDRAAEERSST
jgi:hypothetical protein